MFICVYICVNLDIFCTHRKQSEISMMWADHLAFSHSERIWPGIGPRSVGGPKKSPRVITVLVLRLWYRFLPRYHPSLQSPLQSTATNIASPYIAYEFASPSHVSWRASLSHFLSHLPLNELREFFRSSSVFIFYTLILLFYFILFFYRIYYKTNKFGKSYNAKLI